MIRAARDAKVISEKWLPILTKLQKRLFFPVTELFPSPGKCVQLLGNPEQLESSTETRADLIQITIFALGSQEKTKCSSLFLPS